MTGPAERERLAYIHRRDPVMLAKIHSEFQSAEPIKGETKVKSTWLDSRISKELLALDTQRAEAMKAEQTRARGRILEINEALRLGLGDKFLSNTACEIEEGFATFAFRGELYTVTQEYNSKQFLLNSKPIKDAPGTLADKIIATLVEQEDKKRFASDGGISVTEVKV